MKYISEKIRKYFSELIDRKIYVIDVVDCNANIQNILKEIENERKEHLWEHDRDIAYKHKCIAKKCKCLEKYNEES